MAAQDDELMLLERVFLRVGSAESDEQLQNVIITFLPPVLLKLTSHAEAVRQKVIELLSHFNKRLKSRANVLLPVCELLAQYEDPKSSAFLTNFTIIYIKMGYPRLTVQEQLDLLPLLWKAIQGKPNPHKYSILTLTVATLRHVNYSQSTLKLAEYFKIKQNPEIETLILDYMLDLLLLPYSSLTSVDGVIPGGLSPMSLKRAAGESPPTPDQLEKIKLGILSFLTCGVIPEMKCLPHLVVALADSRHSVFDFADRSLKKQLGVHQWDPAVIVKLLSLFQGTMAVPGQKSVVKPELSISPAGIPLRLKIFPLILKSKDAANRSIHSMQIVFDCLFGKTTNTKLKVMAIQFVHQMCHSCNDERFSPVAKMLCHGMKQVIAKEKEEEKLLSLAYVAVAKIIQRVPSLITHDLSLLEELFQALIKESPEVGHSVQEALLLMSSTLKGKVANEQILEAMLLQQMEKSEHQARLMAVHYAKDVLNADNIVGRYILLLASGDRKDEISCDAIKALQGVVDNAIHQANKLDKSLFAAFVDMVHYIHEKAEQRIKSRQVSRQGNYELPFTLVSYTQMLLYMRVCLASSANVNLQDTYTNMYNVSSLQAQCPCIAQYLQTDELLATPVDNNRHPLAIYMHVCVQLLNTSAESRSMYCLLEIVAINRKQLACRLYDQLDWIEKFMVDSKEEMRDYACQLCALIVAYKNDKSEQDAVLERMITKTQSKVFEEQHCGILTVGYLLGWLLAPSSSNGTGLVVEDITMTDNSDSQTKQMQYTKYLESLATFIDNTQTLLSSSACLSIGEIGRNGPLPIPLSKSENPEALTTIDGIVENLIAKVNSTKTAPKLRERAAIALGNCCVGDKTGFKLRKRVIEGLLACAETRQFDVITKKSADPKVKNPMEHFEFYFTVGESLVHAALGAQSSAGRNIWLVAEEHKLNNPDSDDVETLLVMLLEKYLPDNNPHIRQAACIWLLSLVKQCGSHQAILSSIHRIQNAFMNLLTDNNEVTQDVAAKGVALVYENCDSSQKQTMVSTLVDTLMVGRKSKQTITKDTVMFKEGSLGKTPDGKGLSTYRELCSLATDLNQPDLIYKFLNLAHHNAMWNSRKGAAFGFSTIATQAGDQLAPYLPKIVPKLYRYQFDPNPDIRQIMTTIWSSLVSDSKKIVDEYLEKILVDLLKHVISPQWRERQSCCNALNDLIRGRVLDSVVCHFPEMWELLFKVLDDIKESVRVSADVTIKTLSRICINMSEPAHGKVASNVTATVLPVLLKTGLGSPAKEVQSISLQTIMKMSKNAGSLLKPHIPLLVSALLEALSSLEPQMLNYLSLQVTNNQDSAEKLDNIRISASKTSPMMETINTCIQFVDKDVLVELMPRLTEVVRNGIGLGTKACCAHVVINLAHQCTHDLTPFAGKMLNALVGGLSDRNVTVKKGYASAIGHLVRVAKQSSVERVINKLKLWYLEKDEESIQNSCALTIHSISQKSPDVLKAHATNVMPLAFLAMHQKKTDEDGKDTTQPLWEEIWLDSTPGTEGGLRLYLPEVVTLVIEALESNSWPMKARAATAIETIVSKMKGNLKAPELDTLLAALLQGLSGRTWTGKVALLKALSSMCLSCKETLTDPKYNEQVTQIHYSLLRECKRESVQYRMEALICTSEVMESYQHDYFTQFYEICLPLLKKHLEPDSDIDRRTQLDFEACILECLGTAWSTIKANQTRHQEGFSELLSCRLSVGTWQIDLAILKSFYKFIDRSYHFQDGSNLSEEQFVQRFVLILVKPLCEALGSTKVSVRKEALGVSNSLLTKLKACGSLSIVSSEQQALFKESLNSLKSNNPPELQDQAHIIIKLLQNDDQDVEMKG